MNCEIASKWINSKRITDVFFGGGSLFRLLFRSRSQFRGRLGRLGSAAEEQEFDESQLTDEPSEAEDSFTAADLSFQPEPEVVKV